MLKVYSDMYLLTETHDLVEFIGYCSFFIAPFILYIIYFSASRYFIKAKVLPFDMAPKKLIYLFWLGIGGVYYLVLMQHGIMFSIFFNEWGFTALAMFIMVYSFYIQIPLSITVLFVVRNILIKNSKRELTLNNIVGFFIFNVTAVVIAIVVVVMILFFTNTVKLYDLPLE